MNKFFKNVHVFLMFVHYLITRIDYLSSHCLKLLVRMFNSPVLVEFHDTLVLSAYHELKDIAIIAIRLMGLSCRYRSHSS